MVHSDLADLNVHDVVSACQILVEERPTAKNVLVVQKVVGDLMSYPVQDPFSRESMAKLVSNTMKIRSGRRRLRMHCCSRQDLSRRREVLEFRT